MVKIRNEQSKQLKQFHSDPVIERYRLCSENCEGYLIRNAKIGSNCREGLKNESKPSWNAQMIRKGSKVMDGTEKSK